MKGGEPSRTNKNLPDVGGAARNSDALFMIRYLIGQNGIAKLWSFVPIRNLMINSLLERKRKGGSIPKTKLCEADRRVLLRFLDEHTARKEAGALA